MKAISIMQPWAWLIVMGFKDIENRDWLTNYRGPAFVHAGKKCDHDAMRALQKGRHPVTGEVFPEAVYKFESHVIIGADSPLNVGGIVGMTEIVDCVSSSSSPWFVGDYGFVVRNSRPLPFKPLRGQLGFFNVPPEIEAMAA